MVRVSSKVRRQTIHPLTSSLLYPRDLVTLQIILAVVKRRRMIVVLVMALSGGACSGTDDVSVAEPVVTTTTTNVVTTTTTSTTTTSTTTTVPTQVSAAEGLGDSFYPYLGNGGYDVLHYEIDLDIDPTANTIQALTTITAQATQELSEFNLDLSGLTVEDVRSQRVRSRALPLQHRASHRSGQSTRCGSRVRHRGALLGIARAGLRPGFVVLRARLAQHRGRRVHRQPAVRLYELVSVQQPSE